MSIEDWEDGRDQAGGKARQGMAWHGMARPDGQGIVWKGRMKQGKARHGLDSTRTGQKDSVSTYVPLCVCRSIPGDMLLLQADLDPDLPPQADARTVVYCID